MSILSDATMRYTDNLRRQINQLYCRDFPETSLKSFDIFETDDSLTFSYALPQHLQEFLCPRLSTARLNCHSGVLSVSFPKTSAQSVSKIIH
jgi:hypothetical protein